MIMFSNITLPDYVPLLLQVIFLGLIVTVVALIDLYKHETCRIGNKVIWAIVIILVQWLGTFAYFIFGRGKE